MCIWGLVLTVQFLNIVWNSVVLFLILGVTLYSRMNCILPQAHMSASDSSRRPYLVKGASTKVIKVKWGHEGGLSSMTTSVLIRRGHQHTDPQREGVVRTQGGDSCLYTEKKGTRRNQPPPHLDLEGAAFGATRNKRLLSWPPADGMVFCCGHPSRRRQLGVRQ